MRSKKQELQRSTMHYPNQTEQTATSNETVEGLESDCVGKT